MRLFEFDAGRRYPSALEPRLVKCVGALFAVILLLTVGVMPSGRASEWRVDQQRTSKRVKSLPVAPAGVADETRTRLAFQSAEDVQPVYVAVDQAASLPHDDFVASVNVGSNLTGLRLALRLRFPQQLDPRTGQPLTALIRGPVGRTQGQQQRLQVSGSAKNVQATVRELRAETFEKGIDATGVYVDGCVLVAEVHRGTSVIEVSDLQYGPVVTVPALAAMQPSEPVPTHLPVEIRRDQVLFSGQPGFLRLMPDHGESIAFLRQLGVNAVWVSDLSQTERMQELIRNNIVVVATPPHPQFDPADFRTPLQGLSPLEVTHPLPSIWYLGTRVSPDQMSHLLAWGREVRSADRTLARPLMADVRALEGVASRQVDFVGLSQHRVGGHNSFGKSRNASYLRQNASAQLMLPWEWVQSEPPASHTEWRRRSGLPPTVVEPEQVLMQTVAVLSSGCHGLGVWKTGSLEPLPGQSLSETAMAIELASLYVRILEPFLVKGSVEGHIGIKVADRRGPREQPSWLDQTFGNDTVRPSDYTADIVVPDAALLNSPGASLILAGYWDASSHLVPQELHSAQAVATVAATETASAWQVTATGLRGLRRVPTAGGLKLDIRDFDQLAMVLVTSSLADRETMSRKVHATAERAAQLLVQLATAKSARVRHTTEQIDALVGGDQMAIQLLARADQQIEQASLAGGRRDFAGCERLARSAMRELRKVQSRYWYRAVQSLPTPMASPFTTSFSALPDHWRMMDRVQTAGGVNLLPSGGFEDLRQLSEGAWLPVPPEQSAFQSNADVVADADTGNQVLRLRTWQRDPEGNTGEEPTFLVRSPEIAVEKGAVYEITGRVRQGRSVPSRLAHPFAVFDSDLGPEFAVKPKLERTWQVFRIFRQPSQSGPLRLWLSLQGPGEVFIDELAVRQISPARPTAADSVLPVGSVGGARPGIRETGSQVQGAGYSIDRKARE